MHIDGARLANAAASLGVPLGTLAVGVEADVISLGATKNGGLVGDAVVFLDPGLGKGFEYIRKQGMQLASKMRFLSAQFEALLGPDELWRRNAEAANAMAARLGAGVEAIDGVELLHPVQANGVFVRLAAPRHRPVATGAPRRAPLLHLGRGRRLGPLDVLLGHDRIRRRRPARRRQIRPRRLSVACVPVT